MLEAGLIAPEQFHGVEGNPVTHAANAVAVKQPANLYCGEISAVMDAAHTAGAFRPGIINLDTVEEPKGASKLLGRVVSLLNHTKDPCLLSVNVVLGNHRWKRRDKQWAEAEETLMSRCSGNGVWSRVMFEGEPGYRYRGHGGFVMGSFVVARDSNA